MKYTKAQVARHLGVDTGSLMEVAERGDQVVVILTDYRKYVIPAVDLPVEAAVEPTTAPKKSVTRK
ncbi:hypothetical protein [Thauera sp.]|uniref:hypothetical protein n=1 Tax=Thauera sp. TaxID=1905334 RepID=UPI002BF73A5D|nr:hypothetical protein [Thauera sp.]HRP25951.1 hypothetical protein [Thauera sp.]